MISVCYDNDVWSKDVNKHINNIAYKHCIVRDDVFNDNVEYIRKVLKHLCMATTMRYALVNTYTDVALWRDLDKVILKILKNEWKKPNNWRTRNV